MSEFKTITAKQWADYERIVDELEALRTSDVLRLKQIWEANYITVCRFDDEGAKPLFRRLVAMKDFLKDKCLAGAMENYHRARVKCRGRLIYKRVWKEQIEILSARFLEHSSKELVQKIDALRGRLFVYKNENEEIEKMVKRLEIDVFQNGYQVIGVEKNGVEFVVGFFEQLADAEREMHALLHAEMLAQPDKFGFENFG